MMKGTDTSDLTLRESADLLKRSAGERIARPFLYWFFLLSFLFGFFCLLPIRYLLILVLNFFILSFSSNTLTNVLKYTSNIFIMFVEEFSDKC